MTSDIVRKATEQIKPNKNGSVLAFNSDCLKCAPPMLFPHQINIFKCILIHGHGSKSLLNTVIVSLLKDKLETPDVVIITD